MWTLKDGKRAVATAKITLAYFIGQMFICFKSVQDKGTNMCSKNEFCQKGLKVINA